MKSPKFVLLTFLSAVCLARAQSATVSKAEEEAHLFVLASVDFGDVYSDDGAADGTITYKGELLKSVGANLKPDARVKAVVDLREAAVPLLIAHSDDTRPTQTMFKGSSVPLGHMALDILTHIITPTSTIFITDCGYDGLGACIHNGYYFRPDAPLDEMERTKKKWQQLYARGLVQFKYPALSRNL
jgi:hypothetical protein